MNGKALNKLSYRCIEGVPAESDIQLLLALYQRIFEDAKTEFFLDRLHTKEALISLMAYENMNPVGFKIGYRYDPTTFYSWIGGVLKPFRKQGIGAELARLQEQKVREKNYTKLRTKSMNKYKSMMILNLKNGFDIVKIYTNKTGQTKLIFEKNL